MTATADEPRSEDFFRDVVGRAVDTAGRVLGSRATAEDIAVEALIRAHGRWGKVATAPYREAWVLRVTSTSSRRGPPGEPPSASPAGVRRSAPAGTVDGYGCAGSYAYAFVAVPPPAGAAAGTPGIEETLQLKGADGRWSPIGYAASCGADLVPAAIHHDACETN